MDLKKIAQALAGAVNNAPNFGANINDTAANTGELQNIRNLAALTGQGKAGRLSTNALGTAAAQKDEEEKAAQRLAAQQAQDDAKKAEAEVKRLTDPNEFKATINDKGGYDFTNPLGAKISAVQYARAKNIQLTDVFKDSQDPNDQDFVDDYKKLTELGKIVQSGNGKARDKFFKNNPDWKEAFGESSYGDIVKKMHSTYPGYFRSDQELQRNKTTSSTRINSLASEEEKKKKGWIGNLLGGLFD